jgi:predicted kinase
MSAAPPAVVVVSGPPASGKTTLAARLAADLRLPLHTKDRIKEALFDTLGGGDRAWSRKLGAATMEVLYHAVESELAAGCACVAEANFHPEWATPRFRDLQARYPCRPVQVQCRADGPTLLARFQARAVAGTRHPGHLDHLLAGELAPVLLRGYYDALDLDGPIFHVDTTDFAAVDYPALLAAVSAAIAQPA